ncbi:MAG: HEAT repeat domain-containing protein [Phycisphaerales bacterium]
MRLVIVWLVAALVWTGHAPRAAAEPPPHRGGRDADHYPRDGTLKEAGEWVWRECARRAWARLPPATGAACRTVCVFVEPGVLPAEEWGCLAERCRAAIANGPRPERLEALGFVSWTLSQAASGDAALVDRIPPGLVDAVAAALESDDLETRRAAVGASFHAVRLSREPHAVIPGLIRVLRAEDAVLRRTASSALSGMAFERDAAPFGPHLPEVLAAMLRALDDPEPQVRMHAYSAIGQMRDGAGAALPTLIEQTRHDDPIRRRQAIRCLQNLGPHAAPALPALQEALTHADAQTRMSAALALGALGERAWVAVPRLTEGLDDRSEYVAMYCARALGEIGPGAAAAMPRLRAAVAQDPEAFSGYGRMAIDLIRPR